jgi:hypothetical protein
VGRGTERPARGEQQVATCCNRDKQAKRTNGLP